MVLSSGKFVNRYCVWLEYIGIVISPTQLKVTSWSCIIYVSGFNYILWNSNYAPGKLRNIKYLKYFILTGYKIICLKQCVFNLKHNKFMGPKFYKYSKFIIPCLMSQQKGPIFCPCLKFQWTWSSPLYRLFKEYL